MARPLPERIADQEKKLHDETKRLKQLKARLARETAREKRLESERQRKSDTRRKILAGSWILQMIENQKFSREEFLQGMETFLTRADDRVLFGLSTPNAQPSKL